MSGAPAASASVVICCYDDGRWNDVLDATRSALTQEPPPLEIVLVVDHNPGLLARLKAEFPAVAVVANAQARGLSGARNCGVAAARGEAIVFLDDDAMLAPGALAALLAPLAEPSVLGVGAAIRPLWSAGAPRWFPREFLWVVGCTYAGLAPGPVRNLIGAAMCVRRSVFSAVGGFANGLGRDGARLPLGCEETELCIRAGRAAPGGRFVHDPRAVCLHRVPAKRATWRYFAARCYAEGVSKAHVSALAGAHAALSTERTYVIRTLRDGVLGGLADAGRGRPGAIGRVAAIGFGLAVTLAGYAFARVRLRGGRPAPSAAAPALPEPTGAP